MRLCYLGRVEYAAALEIQYKLLALRQKDEYPDILLLLEHDPVITLGTRGQMSNVYISREQQASQGVKIYKVSRGGDVTYHGPGQLIGYPIVKLYGKPGKIRGFVHNLEQAAVDMLAHSFGLQATCRDGKLTGVWIGEEKIMALGISVHQGVTMHGFALNVSTDLEHFSWINPCGLSRGVTSIDSRTGTGSEIADVARDLGTRIALAVDGSADWLEPARLMEAIRDVALPPMRLEEVGVDA